MGQGSQKESSTQNKANKIKGLQQVTPVAAHACNNVVLLPHAVTKEGVTHMMLILVTTVVLAIAVPLAALLWMYVHMFTQRD